MTNERRERIAHLEELIRILRYAMWGETQDQFNNALENILTEIVALLKECQDGEDGRD